MSPNLPDALERLLRPVFDALPLHMAMTALVVKPAEGDGHPLVPTIEKIIANPIMKDRESLVAGLWLYVDELDRSHRVSQEIDNATGSFWHGIMHRREGDFSNSHYWFRKVGKHPAMARIDIAGGGAGAGTEIAHYDPHAFIDRVEAATRHSRTPSDLIALQRHEWLALFEWCAQR